MDTLDYTTRTTFIIFSDFFLFSNSLFSSPTFSHYISLRTFSLQIILWTFLSLILFRTIFIDFFPVLQGLVAVQKVFRVHRTRWPAVRSSYHAASIRTGALHFCRGCLYRVRSNTAAGSRTPVGGGEFSRPRRYMGNLTTIATLLRTLLRLRFL